MTWLLPFLDIPSGIRPGAAATGFRLARPTEGSGTATAPARVRMKYHV